jgi:small subunit ribosomal protein S6
MEESVNFYETVIIFKSDSYKESFAKAKTRLQTYSGSKKIDVRDIGEKELSYPIKEIYTRGYYGMFTWQGTEENVAEFERLLRIDDNVIKFMTVKLDETADVELEDYVPEEAESEQPLHVTSDAWDKIFD